MYPPVFIFLSISLHILSPVHPSIYLSLYLSACKQTSDQIVELNILDRSQLFTNLERGSLRQEYGSHRFESWIIAMISMTPHFLFGPEIFIQI